MIQEVGRTVGNSGESGHLGHMRERVLRIVYDDDVSTFDQLLVMGNLSVFIIKISRDS